MVPKGSISIRAVLVVELVLMSLLLGLLRLAFAYGYQACERESFSYTSSLEAQLAEAVKKDGERPRNLVLPEWEGDDFFYFAHEIESIDPLPGPADGFLYFIATMKGVGRTDRFVGKIRAGEMERMAFGVLKCQLDSAKSARSGK